MRRFGLFLVVILAVSAVVLPLAYFYSSNQGNSSNGEFFFGVTYGQDTVEGAKLLIDKVQNYTNVFVVDSSPISKNETALNAICSYAAGKNLHFIVYFFSAYSSLWQQEWVTTARQTWGDKFLGVYLRDEPGGRQIELAETVKNASSPSEAVKKYVYRLSSNETSMKILKDRQISVVTSDFALYWYDYQAGFDVVFAQLGWNNTRAQEIALCRGAATMQGKEWGTIVTWTYQHPPYMENGTEVYKDMVTSYEAGAKYILVFNYPRFPDTNQYGILFAEHFSAMQQFWDYAKAHPRNSAESNGEVALGRCRNMNDVGTGLSYQLRQISEMSPDVKAFGQLPGHQLFKIADPHDLAALDPLNLRCVRVRDFSAADYGDSKHDAPFPCSSRSSGKKPPLGALPASNLDAPSVWRSNSGFSSRTRASPSG